MVFEIEPAQGFNLSRFICSKLVTIVKEFGILDWL